MRREYERVSNADLMLLRKLAVDAAKQLLREGKATFSMYQTLAIKLEDERAYRYAHGGPQVLKESSL